MNNENVKILVKKNTISKLCVKCKIKNSFMLAAAYELQNNTAIDRLQRESNELAAAVDILAFGDD